MSRVWWATGSLVVSLVVLLGAGVLGSLGLAVVCGLWATGSAFWLIWESFVAYAREL